MGRERKGGGETGTCTLCLITDKGAAKQSKGCQLSREFLIESVISKDILSLQQRRLLRYANV